MGKCLSKQAGSKGERPDKQPYTRAKPSGGDAKRAEVPADGAKPAVPVTPDVTQQQKSTLRERDEPKPGDGGRKSPELKRTSATPTASAQTSDKPSEDKPSENAKPDPSPEPSEDRTSGATADGPELLSQKTWSSHSRTVTATARSYRTMPDPDDPTKEIKIEISSKPMTSFPAGWENATVVGSSSVVRSSLTKTTIVTTGDEEPDVKKEEMTMLSRLDEGIERAPVSSTITAKRTTVIPSGGDPEVVTTVLTSGDPSPSDQQDRPHEFGAPMFGTPVYAKSPTTTPTSPIVSAAMSPTSPQPGSTFSTSYEKQVSSSFVRSSTSNQADGTVNGVSSEPTSPLVNGVNGDVKVLSQSETNGPSSPEVPVEDVEDEREEEGSDLGQLQDLKQSVCELLPDFKAQNDAIRQDHTVLSNTRTKALQAIDRWFTEGVDTPRLLLITGEVGMGKTCLASELCRRHEDKLVAHHFFRTHSAHLNHNDLRAAIQWLSRGLCENLLGYVSVMPRPGRIKELQANGDASELAQELLQQPLSNPDLERDPGQRALLVLDALDECNPRDRDVLLRTVNALHSQGPQWLYICVTSRNEEALVSSLNGAKVMEMKRSNEALSDIKKILREPLGHHMDRISLDGGLNHLAKQSEASFLCAHVLAGRVKQLPEGKTIALREADGLFPTGLSANLTEVITNTKDLMVSDGLKDTYKTLVSIICASKEPLHVDFIHDIVRPDKVDSAKIALNSLDPLLDHTNDQVDLCSTSLREWLTNESVAGDLAADLTLGNTKLAGLCMEWLGDILNDGKGSRSGPLRAYALKHVIHHLVAVPKQQEQIAKVLCSLPFAQEKIKLDGVDIGHLITDYKHEDVSQLDDRAASVKESLKKHQKLAEEVRSYERFFVDRRYEITVCPEFLFHVAANYPAMDRIQSNARVEIGRKPWIEDVTAVPESQSLSKSFRGRVKAACISADGQSAAVVTKDEEYNIRLHVVDTKTGQETLSPVDIKSLDDRLGLQCLFMADTPNVFVGSMTTLLNSKNGKKVLSGFDVVNIELKEKFSIECSAVSARHFVCGLTTFPWGGRSLHIAVFDMRTKKCLKTIEVLRFRFGGSSQFSIRGLAVARDKPLMAACVRQSTKPQLRLVVWNISKFQVTNSIDVNNDVMSKCLFVGDQNLLIGGSMRSITGAKGTIVPVITEQWHFKDVKNKASEVWDHKEMYSLFSSSGESTVVCRWYSASGTVIVERWNGPSTQGPPDVKCKIRGLIDVAEVHVAGNRLVFVSHNQLYFYDLSELEQLGSADDSTVVPNITDVAVDSLSFIPKSDILMLVSSQDNACSAYLCDLSQEDVGLYPTPFQHYEVQACQKLEGQGQFTMFRGVGACSDICSSSADGNSIFFNGGDKVHIWDRVNDALHEMPTYEQDKGDTEGLKAFASPKDNIVAVVYGQAPSTIVLYDIRSRQRLRTMEHPGGSAKSAALTDLAFLPHTGMLLTFCRGADSTLCSWNPRSGDLLNKDKVAMHYARMSPASDRLVISARKARREGQVVLRGADNKFNKVLPLGEHTWLHGPGESDVEFSQDGTVLVGVCWQGNLCRVWNAGNGEVLRDLPASFTCDTDIIGLVTNTHALFYDDRLLVVDIASGHVAAILPVDQHMERKTSYRGLRVSPRCEHVVGATTLGQLCAFRCHNFTVVKRRTSLQRVKSFQK